MLRFHRNCKASQIFWKLHITSGFHVWTWIKANDHYVGGWFLHTNCPNWSISGAVVHVFFELQRDLSTLVSFSDNMFTNTWKCLCFSTTCLAPPFGFTASSSNRLAAPLATPVGDTTSLPLQGIHHHSASATQVSSFLQGDESEFYPKPLRIILTESCKMSQVSDIPFFPWSPTLAKVLVPQLFWGPLCHWNPLRRGWSGWRWNCNEMTAWHLNGGIQ